MALRADDENSNSPLPGLNYFWQDAEITRIRVGAVDPTV